MVAKELVGVVLKALLQGWVVEGAQVLGLVDDQHTAKPVKEPL
jgi:hypothetical protein